MIYGNYGVIILKEAVITYRILHVRSMSHDMQDSIQSRITTHHLSLRYTISLRTYKLQRGQKPLLGHSTLASVNTPLVVRHHLNSLKNYTHTHTTNLSSFTVFRLSPQMLSKYDGIYLISIESVKCSSTLMQYSWDIYRLIL